MQADRAMRYRIIVLIATVLLVAPAVAQVAPRAEATAATGQEAKEDMWCGW
ncbi:hypothetical protein [Phreatobacter stygius]|uniref:hypothetical protein n=1 Tax=Phreatobacter stygius TaxID=1940610 RepID=UPI0014772598|nr:hypothetical protein [Phreatobacter stygius]